MHTHRFPTLVSAFSLLLLLLAFGAVAVNAAPLTLYVASDGRDGASGRFSDPLATLIGARDRLRALKRAGQLPQIGATVLIHGGTYFQKEAFTLTAADDLSPAPVTYAASPGETVRITGGQEVRGWQTVTDPAVLSRLDPAAQGHVLQADLKAQGITDFGQMSPRGFGKPVTTAETSRSSAWPKA